MKQRLFSAMSSQGSDRDRGRVGGLPRPAPTLAGAAGDLGSANTVYIKDGKGGLRFVAPKTIVAGEELEVLNETNPKQVGPHTFSLVTKGSIPKTPKARKNCFTPKHICMAIANWHGVKGNGPVENEPGQSRRRRLGHARQPDQEGRLLVHRREAGRPRSPSR